MTMAELARACALRQSRTAITELIETIDGTNARYAAVTAELTMRDGDDLQGFDWSGSKPILREVMLVGLHRMQRHISAELVKLGVKP